MRRAAVASAVCALAAVVPAAAAGPLPGARELKICAAAGAYWPTMTLALQARAAWIACKEQSRVIRVDTASGRTTASVRLGGQAIAVASGLGSTWALDSSGVLYRLHPSSAKILERIPLPVRAAYNIWIGGGSVWVADDQGAQVVRVSPRTNRVVARIRVGDGPADIAFADGTAWVIAHRDRVVTRIDLATNRSEPLVTLGGDAPERIAWARGSLWITGRGTDLLKVRPTDGSLETTIEIGASGIDLAVDGDDLIVPTRNAEVDQRGFPTMETLKRISTSAGTVTTLAEPRGGVDVHGLAAASGVVWIADNTRGRLYRLP